MTVLPGLYATADWSLPPNGLSASLGLQTGVPLLNCSRDASFSKGPLTALGVNSFVHWGISGLPFGMFDAQLFEKILVMPRKLDAGFVLSDRVSNVEVWNTHMATERRLNVISIAGPGNLVILGPSPMTFEPGQSQIYTADLPAAGDATIRAVATWSFTGELGADLTVTGTRIYIFGHRCDWSEPYRETIAYLTEVFPGYDASEQRRSLRQRPRYTLSYRVLSATPLETTTLEALLYGWQAREFGVPVWPEASLLLAGVSPGAVSLSVDTTDRLSFEVGGMVMVWTDFATWEAFGVASVAAGSVGLASQVVGTWAAGARVVPLRRGHLAAEQTLGRPANWISAGAFSFTCEAV